MWRMNSKALSLESAWDFYHEMWRLILILPRRLDKFCFSLISMVAACGGNAGLTNSTEILVSNPRLEPVILDVGGVYCPGEHLTWSLDWKSLKGASMQLLTGQPGAIADQRAIIVRSVSRSSELANLFRDIREELTSEIALATGLPIQNSSDVHEDNERELTEVRFSPQANGYSLTLGKNTGKSESWEYTGTPKIHDLHSLVGMSRQWQAATGTRGIAHVQNGRSLYRVEFVIGKSQSLSTAKGPIAAIPLQGRAQRIFMDGKTVENGALQSFTMWRSDDQRFLPLRFEVDTRIGNVRGELVEYSQSPDSPCIVIAP